MASSYCKSYSVFHFNKYLSQLIQFCFKNFLLTTNSQISWFSLLKNIYSLYCQLFNCRCCKLFWFFTLIWVSWVSKFSLTSFCWSVANELLNSLFCLHLMQLMKYVQPQIGQIFSFNGRICGCLGSLSFCLKSTFGFASK